MQEKVFILLSGGIDSSSALGMALQAHPGADFEAVTIDYGQRHHVELEAAKAVAAHFGVPHVVIDAKGFMSGMLVNPGNEVDFSKSTEVTKQAELQEIPSVSYEDLPKGISPTYVTFRNGLMLSILAARAQAWVMEQQRQIIEEQNAKGGWAGAAHYESSGDIPEDEQPNAYLYIGVHADDGANWAYPDCTQEFVGPMAAAIYVGTYNRVRLRTPFTFHDKATVVMLGEQFNVPWALTWSCYKGGEKHCGVCPTCRSRKEAFQVLRRGGVNIKDPTQYEA